MPEAARGKPIEIWWQDEARIGQQGTLTRVWAERGSRPRAPRDQRYKWAYLFGAICPARGVGAAWVLPHANVKAMNLHLQEISCQVEDGAHAVVVLDGAGWHQTGGRLRLPHNISLLHLPPYSPGECRDPDHRSQDLQAWSLAIWVPAFALRDAHNWV